MQIKMCLVSLVGMSNIQLIIGVTVLAPVAIWQMPLCCVYLLMSIKSGVLDFTIGIMKKVIHFNGESLSFCNMM